MDRRGTVVKHRATSSTSQEPHDYQSGSRICLTGSKREGSEHGEGDDVRPSVTDYEGQRSEEQRAERESKHEERDA